MNKILSYQGIITKAEFIAELKKHQEADNFISGTYWNEEKKKGCAVGCSLESIARLKSLDIEYCDHFQYPKLLGIPTWMARVEDTLFEGVPPDVKKSWPLDFAQAIPENVDLEQVKAPFLICVLERTLSTFDHDKFPHLKKSIDTVINLYKTNGSLEYFSAVANANAIAVVNTIAAVGSLEYFSAVANANAIAVVNATAAAVSAVVNAAIKAVDAVEAVDAVANAMAAVAYANFYAETYEYFADQLLEMLRNVK